MRTVFSSASTVAHMWANKAAEEARNGGGNLFFRGDSIYSYGMHFCIGKHVETRKGKAILLTTRKYSNTTAKHVCMVRDAARHKNTIECARPEDVSSANEYSDHSRNIADFTNKFDDLLRQLSGARKPEKYLNKIDGLRQNVRAYAEIFDLKSKEVKLILEQDCAAPFADYLKQREKAIKVDKKRMASAAARKLKKEAKNWREGKTHRLYGAKYDLLRWNAEKQRVETSQHVQIPVAIAKVFYGKITAIRSAGGCSGECGELIMGYALTEVSDEQVRVGCHTVLWTEINALAESLGW